MAKPFAPHIEEVSPKQFMLKFFSPRTGRLRIEQSFSAAGPFSPFMQQKTISRGENQFHFKFNEKTDGYLNIQWH
ncbi:hypothetical protein [Nitrosomonas ureae]|uniref:hypothetical protein n=1 Tax=Nitrosomonas ureae TaxID=44577 RepID=UPI001F349CE7|nr:hypothetical protein [Nitrosomonas ureae]